MADHNPTELPFTRGQRLLLPGKAGIVKVRTVEQCDEGIDLYVANQRSGKIDEVRLTFEEIKEVRVIMEDGAAKPEVVLAGLWNEWMLGAMRSAQSTVLASTPLKPYPHQMDAVYNHMLTQPLLRFLLADEPGTGKTIMSGLWLREAQRLGLVRRALVVCPAHLVIKWKADFERFFGQTLREITAETIRQRALSGSEHDFWVVSLNLASINASVLRALHPDEAGWEAIIFDEAHRMTPTAGTFYKVGKTLSANVPHAVFLTATPHRGDEWYFRELLHLVDPDVFPTNLEEGNQPPKARPTSKGTNAKPLKPGQLHFLRRMKEELVDYDHKNRLFKEREAVNIKVRMNSQEQRFYDRAVELVETFYPPKGRTFAAMVYGKRAASSLYSLAETLRRRSEKMGTDDVSLDELTDNDDDYEEDSEELVVGARSLDAKAEKASIAELLAQLDPLLNSERPILQNLDVSKWEPMVDRLTKNGISPGSGKQLVVFTEYGDTAKWLVRLFEEADFTARSYSGDDDHQERAEIQANFMSGKFEVIVSTDAGNEGIDLQAANVLVNWDIPWSLVRLEQRMGRIHRIGQEQKVMLYNLVALGTREGDAHGRLLDKLIEAANELDGRMFDSLQAIWESIKAESSPSEPQQLLRLFYDSDGGSSERSRHADDFPSVDEIRKARDNYFEELRELKSDVDVAAANRARQDDTLARINPIIVERFLSRVEAGNVLTCSPAPVGSTGFYYLSIDQERHGWRLPPEFSTFNEKTLVTTNAEARQRAINDGVARAAEAIMLGPSDPALQELCTALRTHLGPEMWQGAVLGDRSASEDYTLFVYECDITEGSSKLGPKHPLRKSTLSWLIRVTIDGEKRDKTGRLAWETLLNLEPLPGLEPLSIPTDNLNLAHRQAVMESDIERTRRALKLNSWVTLLRKQLRGLPNDLTFNISNREARLAQKEAITATIKSRIEVAESLAQVECSEPRRVGWAHVIALKDGDNNETIQKNPDSEAISMRMVKELLRAESWKTFDVHTENCGYDLRAERGSELRCVEVKGLAGSASSHGITLTGGELTKALQLGNEYWLYVVDRCEDGEGRLYGAWQDPARKFSNSFQDVTAVRLPGRELKGALELQGVAA